MKRALASVLRGREWVAGITEGTVKVSVADVRVEHEVKMTEFTKWLDRPSGSPRENSAAKSSGGIGYANHARVKCDWLSVGDDQIFHQGNAY